MGAGIGSCDLGIKESVCYLELLQGVHELAQLSDRCLQYLLPCT